jgi:hypothetical protein
MRRAFLNKRSWTSRAALNPPTAGEIYLHQLAKVRPLTKEKEMRIRQDDTAENPMQSQLLARLQAEVNHPEDIDPATDRLGISPFLVNLYLATTVDLSFLGLGQGINLPIQISRRRGGRKSLYYLHPGEKVLAGIVATSKGLVLRYVSRETGHSVPAQGGDEYSEEFRDLEGVVLSQNLGKLEVLNAVKGEGRLVFSDTKTASRWRWILWSCIAKGDGDLISDL